MIVKAMYHKPKLNGYGGQAYTFLTDLPLHPGDKVLVPSADMVGNIHGVWTTANMSIGKFRKTEGGSIWSSDRMRFDKEK